MFQIFPLPFAPQGLTLFLHFVLPLRPAAMPATLNLLPDSDPDDDPES